MHSAPICEEHKPCRKTTDIKPNAHPVVWSGTAEPTLRSVKICGEFNVRWTDGTSA